MAPAENEFWFPGAFSFEVDPEFPGSGVWDVPVFNYGRDGDVTSQVEPPWGTPMVVRFDPALGSPWVGMFAAGGLGHLRAVVGCPSPTQVAVIVDGLVYVVDVERPQAGALMVSDQIQQVVAMPKPPMLLFVGYSEIDALGPAGIAWSSPRLCLDDLAVVDVAPDSIVCTCDNAGVGGSRRITVDPASGEQIAGATMRDLGFPG